MAECEGKVCYKKVYDVKNPKVDSVGGMAAATLAQAVKKAAENAIKEKAEKPTVVECPKDCKCRKYTPQPDPRWTEWVSLPVRTTVVVGGETKEVAGSVDRRSKRTEQGECEDPNALMVFAPGEWDRESVIVAAGSRRFKRPIAKTRRG